MKKLLNINDGYKLIRAANTILLLCLFFIVLMLAVITASGKPNSNFLLEQKESKLSVEIQKQLDEGVIDLNFPGSTKRFYAQRKFKENWLTNYNDAKQTWDAMLMIDCVVQYGLNHNDFHPNELLYSTLHDILERPNTVTIEKQARFEIVLTDAILSFVNYLHYGKFNPEYPVYKLDNNTSIGSFAVNHLIASLAANNFQQQILAAQPQAKSYRNLQRQMYLYTGLYAGDCYETPEADIRRVAMNMERLRWANINEASSIQINIPSFLLQFYHAGTIDSFKVIVGKPTTVTPVLLTSIRSFTIAPEKVVPTKLFIDEVLPGAIKEAGYLKQHHYLIYNDAGQLLKPNAPYLVKIKENPRRYLVKQTYACGEPLGAVGFPFLNIDKISMHGTPGKNIFNKEERALSNGCIKIEHPEQLAALLFISDNPKNKIAALNQAIAAHQTKTFTLKNAVNINITYLTCEVKDGELITYKDIYDLDKGLEMEMYGITQQSLAKK